jgi:hypothetical protein
MNPITDLFCAHLPEGALPQLAGLRTCAEVRAHLADGRAWVYWPADKPAVLHRVLAIAGAEVFERRSGLWYRPGRHLPVFGVPAGTDARPLAGVLVPAPVEPLGEGVPSVVPVLLRLERDDRPRPATALRCAVGDLAAWLEMATRRQMAGLKAARSPAGEVLVVGERLPPIVGERFWGRTVLVPLGFRPEPDLGEEVLREALAAGDDIIVLTEDGAERIAGGAFGRVTRAGARLAVGQTGREPQP